jgi:hypothetical protein
MGTGIYYLPADLWIKGYLAVAMLFALSQTFTLAKTVRDGEEARRLMAALSAAPLDALGPLVEEKRAEAV